METGRWAHSVHDKAPFSSGTRSCSEPPSGHGTGWPHSHSFEWQAVQDVGLTVLLCGLIQGSRGGLGQAEEGGGAPDHRRKEP